jgi:hypothetical protein
MMEEELIAQIDEDVLQTEVEEWQGFCLYGKLVSNSFLACKTKENFCFSNCDMYKNGMIFLFCRISKSQKDDIERVYCVLILQDKFIDLVSDDKENIGDEIFLFV